MVHFKLGFKSSLLVRNISQDSDFDHHTTCIIGLLFKQIKKLLKKFVYQMKVNNFCNTFILVDFFMFQIHTSRILV